jgi:hypothetical protein
MFKKPNAAFQKWNAAFGVGVCSMRSKLALLQAQPNKPVCLHLTFSIASSLRSLAMTIGTI